MSKLNKIAFFIVLLAFAGIMCFAQTGIVIPDTTKISQKVSEAAASEQDQQNQNNASVKNQGNRQNANIKSKKGIKQVKSARPDFSKSKGARPNITRPSGSGIPKGVGKPGGVGKRGGR